MQSTVRRRWLCCSVLPSGSTARSSCRRYSSTCIQFMSLMRTAIIAPVTGDARTYAFAAPDGRMGSYFGGAARTTLDAFIVPSACFFASTTTFVPFANFSVEGSSAVTDTPAGTWMVCEPP